MTDIIEKRKPQTFETRGEWFDRILRNTGKLFGLVAIIASVVCAVAHIASQMWVNLAFDFVVMVVFTELICIIGKE